MFINPNAKPNEVVFLKDAPINSLRMKLGMDDF